MSKTICNIELEEIRRDLQRIMMYNKFRNSATKLCVQFNKILKNPTLNPSELIELRQKTDAMLDDWLKESITRFTHAVKHKCL